MKTFLFICAIFLNLFTSCVTKAQPEIVETTVILVRHAEKSTLPTPANPDLTEFGLLRAKELAKIALSNKVEVIFASEFNRTQQTVKEASLLSGVEIQVIPARETQRLVQEIKEKHLGNVVLVAGHSNTVPEVVKLLSGITINEIPETEFDNLYILKIREEQSSLQHFKYGVDYLQLVQ